MTVKIETLSYIPSEIIPNTTIVIHESCEAGIKMKIEATWSPDFSHGNRIMRPGS